MERHEVRALVELRYLDQELAETYRDVAHRFPEDEVEATRTLHGFRADHLRHASRIDDALSHAGRFDAPDQLSDEVEVEIMRLTVPAAQAMDAVDALRALADAERASVEWHERALRGGTSPEVEALIREHLDAERRHAHYLARRAPAAAPVAPGELP